MAPVGAVFGETACGSLWNGDGLLSIGTGGCFAAIPAACCLFVGFRLPPYISHRHVVDCMRL